MGASFQFEFNGLIIDSISKDAQRGLCMAIQSLKAVNCSIDRTIAP